MRVFIYINISNKRQMCLYQRKVNKHAYIYIPVVKWYGNGISYQQNDTSECLKIGDDTPAAQFKGK